MSPTRYHYATLLTCPKLSDFPYDSTKILVFFQSNFKNQNTIFYLFYFLVKILYLEIYAMLCLICFIYIINLHILMRGWIYLFILLTDYEVATFFIKVWIQNNKWKARNWCSRALNKTHRLASNWLSSFYKEAELI